MKKSPLAEPCSDPQPEFKHIIFPHFEGGRSASRRDRIIYPYGRRPNNKTKKNCRTAVGLSRQIPHEVGLEHTVCFYDRHHGMEDYLSKFDWENIATVRNMLYSCPPHTYQEGVNETESAVAAITKLLMSEDDYGNRPTAIHLIGSKSKIAAIEQRLKMIVAKGMFIQRPITIRLVPTAISLWKRIGDMIFR